MVTYDKTFSLDSKVLVELNADGEKIGKYILEDGKLYKVEIAEKYTLIQNFNLCT